MRGARVGGHWVGRGGPVERAERLREGGELIRGEGQGREARQAPDALRQARQPVLG